MQAAGRPRQLGRGQRVVFVGTADITEQIRKVQKAQYSISETKEEEDNLLIISRDVLEWVMKNTVSATLQEF
jgi:predicted type IV restriction endonuclease